MNLSNKSEELNKRSYSDLLDNGFFSFVCAYISLSVLAIYVDFLPPFMVLWALLWILENGRKFVMIANVRKDYLLLFFQFVVFYFWQLASVLYSSDTELAFSNLFGRLSLLLFPVLLISPGKFIKEKVEKLLQVFALGMVLYMIFCFGFALYRSVELNNGQWIFNPHPQEFWLNYFYAEELTLKHHPSYVSMYVLLAALICFESYFGYSKVNKVRSMWFAMGVFLIACQYFISSRAGILVTLIIGFSFFINKAVIAGKKKYILPGILISVVVLTPFILKNQRVDYLVGKIFNSPANYERKEDPRFKIWDLTLKISMDNLLLGVGIGDARNELEQEYIRLGEFKLAKDRFNTHNQYLEVLLETGLIGLVIFLSIFYKMIQIARCDGNYMYIYFIVMSFMFFMFESMLYRLAGVTFFSLFSFLLLYKGKAKSDG